MARRLSLIVVLVAFALAAASERPMARDDKAAKAPPRAGHMFKDCENCPEMVVIPAGSFTMGSPASEAGRRPNEPQSRVTIARAFAVSRTEVTWDQWEACVRARGCDGIAVENALRSNRDGTPNADFVDWGRGTRPVVGVSWFDGRLRGVAEREDRSRRQVSPPVRCRVGIRRSRRLDAAYPWGDTLDHNYGNFGKEEPGLGGKAEGRDVWMDQTAPVASFPPNKFGLYDMHGNAFEWIEDCHEPDRAHRPPTDRRTSRGAAAPACSARAPSSAILTCTAPPSARRRIRRRRGAATT